MEANGIVVYPSEVVAGSDIGDGEGPVGVLVDADEMPGEGLDAFDPAGGQGEGVGAAHLDELSDGAGESIL